MQESKKIKLSIMKVLLSFLSFALLFGCTTPSKYQDYPIKSAEIRDVTLTDSFWLPKIKTIQKITIRHAFFKCSVEGRMDNFLIAGKKKSGKTCGKMPFDDTDLYKIIEGASYSLVSFPDQRLEAYLDSIIGIIKTGQEPDGYLTTWFTIDRKSPPAWWVKPSTNRWENEISSHELYNSGHLFEAAAAHYLATGKRNFLDIALKNADLLVDNFGPGKLHCPPGHQIVETGLVKLYRITKEDKYLELAKFFLDQRGDSTGHKLYGAYNQDHLPVVKQEEVVGHAVRGVYMYAGMTDIAALYGDKQYLNAVNKLWENMVNKKMYITGGIGARHDGESFGDNYELPNLTAYNETCAAIGSVYWNQRLFQLTGESKYYNVIERTLYNGLISGIAIDGDNFFYPNPLESDGKYPFNQGLPTRQQWFDCSCCPTNIIRFIPSIPGLIYATKNDTLFVNLYISNNANVAINDNKIAVSQTTGYPWNGNIKISIKPEKESSFTLKLRIPGWAQNQVLPGDLYRYKNTESEKVDLMVNGEKSEQPIKEGYITLTQNWKIDNNIELRIPMKIQQVIANEKVVADKNLVAFEYGPFVYCAEEADNKAIDKIFFTKNTDLSIQNKRIHSDLVNAIIGKTSTYNEPVQLIPYYIWANREVGKMKVWFPQSKK
jgi:DUF1680 family protein